MTNLGMVTMEKQKILYNSSWKMVRVISVHHFASQDIHTCEEPLAVTTAPNDRLLIALPQHAIEVRDLKKGGLPSHTFPTVDEVTHMIHCCNGNYVATLEAKRNRQGKEASYARIYANWDVPSKLQPMRARIAGRVTPSSQSGANSLEMIELPVKRAPNVIACCQVSGNMLVGSHKTLVLYKFHVRTHDISKLRFLDFEETLNLELSFCPSHVTLCEDIVSCISKENLHVFRVAIEADGVEERGTRDGDEREKRRHRRRTPVRKEENPKAKSPVVIKDVVKQAATLGSSHHSLRAQLHADSFPIVVHLPSIVEHNKNLSANQLLSITQRAGPFRDARLDMNVKVAASTTNLGEAQVFHILCLQIHACSRAVKEEFRCIKILPMYVEQGGKGHSSSHPMHSSHVSQLVSLAVAVTTQQEGYVYHINYKAASIQGGSGSTEQELVSPPTVYPFTAPVASIALERSILHALTETGLETYTGRAGHHLMQILTSNNRSDSSQLAYPPVEDPVCLVGLRPFFGVEHLLVSENYLCLLACSEGSSTSSQDSQAGVGWTLYSLQVPSCADLYQDMAQVASVHRVTAPSTYLHLLAEAHVVLGTARKCLNWRIDSTSTSGNVCSASPGLEATPEANRRLERCYQESCALLADHYIMGDNDALWDLAKPYYVMSGLNAQQVVDRFLRMEEAKEDESIPDVDDETPKNRSFQGLMHYLRGELPGGVRSGEDFSVEFASQLLELFEQHDPASVSALVLGSATLRQHRMDRVLQVMKRRLLVRSSTSNSEPDSQDALALVLLCLQKGSLDQARTVLGSLMGSAQLVQALQAHHGLLFTCSEVRGRKDITFGFTELALLVAEVQPAALASVLTQLALEPSEASQLQCPPSLTHLTRAFLTPPCSLAGAASNASVVLRFFLESFLSQLPPHYSAAEVSEGACILARSYLALLQDAHKSKGPQDAEQNELFGARLSFLDMMPPFSEDTAWLALQGVTQPKKHITEQQTHTLSKLQSLLCCACLGRECGSEVLQFLHAQPQTPGSLALRALCLTPKESTCQLLDQCPAALLKFAKERYMSESDWKYLLSILQKKMNVLADDSPVRVYYSVLMTETLSHLTHTLTMEELMRVLPGGEAAAQSPTFQPFIHACQHVQSANHIRTLIMATGQQLLTTLNL